jgi:hypothetical protein
MGDEEVDTTEVWLGVVLIRLASSQSLMSWESSFSSSLSPGPCLCWPASARSRASSLSKTWRCVWPMNVEWRCATDRPLRVLCYRIVKIEWVICREYTHRGLDHWHQCFTISDGKRAFQAWQPCPVLVHIVCQLELQKLTYIPVVLYTLFQYT